MKYGIIISFIIVILGIVPLFRLLNYISKKRNRPTVDEVAEAIEMHIDGTEGPWDWDDFTSIPMADDRLDEIRLRCIEFEQNPEELKRIVEELKNLGG
ncbi:MAG: hypothetical protein WAN35_19325 [Terracidiphilus sp.]